MGRGPLPPGHRHDPVNDGGASRGRERALGEVGGGHTAAVDRHLELEHRTIATREIRWRDPSGADYSKSREGALS